ncbi:MAG: translocation/assembly module TamB domain-containing protein [Bacteroidia bacterium]|nr:translocation/assembly module TamB domain-containing protein [Bacteroidia bacterium]
MVKNIKKSLKYFIIIAGVIIMLPTVLYLLLQNSEVQTFLVNRVTKHFSNKIISTISLGKVEYKFFNRLIIDDILIKDKNKDTLIFSQKVTIGIRRIDIRNKSFRLGRVTLIKPVLKFITDSTGIMNLTSYMDLFKNPSDSTKKSKSKFSIDQIDISDARFSLINHTGLRSKTKIDFNNLNFKEINGIIEDLKIQNDTTSFSIYHLGFNESSGFSVKRMSSSVLLAKQEILFNSAYFNCDSSILNISKFGLIADSSSSFKRFTEEVKLDILLEKSLINTSDLQYFIPFSNEINESVWLSGKVYGTVSELRGRNIELAYRDYTSLGCDFDFSGLPKIENTFIFISVNSLKTNAKDIEKIKIPGKGYIIVPEVLNKMGNIAFDGSFTGFITDFVTYGRIRSNLGNIRTDISFRPEESNKYRIKGLLTGSDIDLGELTGNPELLGKLSTQFNVDGFAYSLKKFAGNLTGKIDSIEINRYKYRNITLNGFFTEKIWDGRVNIVDENIKLDLMGLLNFKDELPKFDFTLNIANANLYKLHFDRLDTTSSLSVLLASNFKGNSIDNLDGEIKLLNSSFKKYNNKLELNDFSMRTYTDNNKPVLSLRTDFVDADIKGYYSFAAIGALIKSTLATLMPSQFPAMVRRNELKKNNFTFEITFKNTDKINSFFRTGILLADRSYIRGAIIPDSAISIGGKAKLLTIKNNVFNDFSLDANISGDELSVDINSSSLSLLGQSELKGFSVELRTKPDNFIFTVDWDNKDKNLDRGNFVARGIIAKMSSGKRNAILTINIDSTDIYSRNNLWKISQSSIMLDSNKIDINKLYIRSNDRYYLVDGSVSEDPADTLNLEFKGIDIAPLNYIGNQKNYNDPNKLPFDITGSLNGKILLTNVYKDLLLESNIIVSNFSILKIEYGNVSIVSAWDKARKVAKINASNNLGGVKMFDVAGTYDPGTSKTDLSGKATKLPLDFLNPLLKVFASDISGLASGNVNLSVEPGKLVLEGAVMAENASMKINYLQTKYKMNDTIRFDRNGFNFNNIRLTDEKGNIATLTGSVNHKNLHDYSADLIINTNECLVLNTKPKDNQLFYGTAYASGVTTIKSGANSLSFDISAKTGKNTKFFIPLNKGLSVSEYSFITFVDSSSGKKEEPGIDGIRPTPAPAKQTGMDLNFDLEVTPDAEAQLIFDSKNGDVIKGHGSGNLNINLNKNGDFRISGDYMIEDGDYLFTLGNVLNKSFTVENGGKIIFNGDLDNAEIDIKAIYKLKASLYDILVLDNERSKERIPVECQLSLTGKLFNPIVGFDIYLPTADEKTRTYLRNAISTEEELSRQFLYLLVMNSFIADPSFGSSSSSPTATSAMAVTTTEMLSNQLSNWLSQISNNFDIGFGYLPGTKNISSNEVQLALSTQLLNDKVVINGNINGNIDGKGAGITNNNNPITGDFDAVYKIPDSKISFKVFNRYNNPYTGRTEPYTQGIGIFFQQDFDKLSDLFRKKIKAEIKKEDESMIKEK